MQFDLQEYKDRKYVMHCKSKKEAVKFLTYLRKHDYVWCTGEVYTDYNTLWDVHEEDTCYYFNEGTYGACVNLTDSHVLLEYSDFNWSHNVDIPNLTVDMPTLTADDNQKFDNFIASCIGLESVVNA